MPKITGANVSSISDEDSHVTLSQDLGKIKLTVPNGSIKPLISTPVSAPPEPLPSDGEESMTMSSSFNSAQGDAVSDLEKTPTPLSPGTLVSSPAPPPPPSSP
jgi:hypothetical protein